MSSPPSARRRKPRASSMSSHGASIRCSPVRWALRVPPVRVAVRTAFVGGLVDIGESDYAEGMRGLIAGLTGGPVPLAVDVEIDRAEAPGLIASAREAGIAVIASHHSFESTDSYESLLAT